jgi:hypothetical protein
MFRPTFETLERREVFAANALAVAANAAMAQPPPGDNATPAVIQSLTVSGQGGNDVVRVATGDFNNDGRIDTFKQPQAGNAVLIALLLPYMEQDNIYKQYAQAPAFTNTTFDDQAFVAPVHVDFLGRDAAASDAVFVELDSLTDRFPAADRSQIIAILIGLVQPRLR